jgi:(2Fe-2S) ferredoxin
VNEHAAAPRAASSDAPRFVRLLVCIGPRCDAEGKGSAQLAALSDAVKEAFADEIAAGRVALSTRDCLRHCTTDPVLRVEPSGEVFAGARIEDLLRLVAEALAK